MIKRSMEKVLYIAAIGTLVLAACGDSNPFGPDPATVVFADTLGIDLDDFTETESGLLYRDDVVGTGELAAVGDTVTVSYTGWLVDGTQFDSFDGFTFTLGVANLIPGFTEGIIGMQVGGTRTLIIPPGLAYGSQGSGSTIPGNAVIVFEITLTDLVKA